MLRTGEALFTELVRRQGPVFRHMLGLSPVVFVGDPDCIWSVVRNEDRVWSAALPWTYYLSGLAPGETCDGPLTLDFEAHRDARQLLQPAFSAQAIAGYLHGARQLYRETIDEWMRRGRIGFKAEVRRLFAMISARVLMGMNDPREAEMLDRAMTDGWQAVLAVFKRSAWSPGWQRARRGYGTLWSTLRPLMAERRQGGADLLSQICQARDDAGWLDDDARMRLFINTMFGAFDTTASGAAGMAYLLCKHPTWQDRLRTEARALRSTEPSPEELKSLEQGEWVWKETLRMFPVAGHLSRQALSEVTLGGHRIPPATLIMALTGSAANDPKWWTEPSRFDPERFSPARAEDKRHKAMYLPFGAGAHACVGAQLAGLEIKAFWHALLTRCRFRLARDYECRHTYVPIGIVSGDVELILEAV
jgi:cytochrome P450